jgi:hypothetical protein
MIAKLFTLCTSCVVAIALVLFIQTREVPSLDTQETTPTIQQDTHSKPKEKSTPKNELMAPQDSKLTSSSPEKKVTLTEIKPKIIEQPLRSSTSDTDETYRPSISPCKKPMGYRLGTFDSRFGISKDTFKSEIAQAVSLWEDEANKDLFYYDENATLTVNLIYDERQAKTEIINTLLLDIENAKTTATQLKETYEQEKVLYTRDADSLTSDTERFQERQQAYKDKVAMYNTSGGAQKPEYDAMMNELAQLKEDFSSIETRRTALLAYMEVINKKVARYNEIVIYINGLVKQSNALGAHTFTEGRFRPAYNTIDIFQYDNLTKLRRVIAHEFGHVLGINHTESFFSIMYSFNSATTTTLSSDDKDELSIVCNR